MEEFKAGWKKGLANFGILEYLFGVLAFISIIPVILLYFVLVKFIVQPIFWLINRKKYKRQVEESKE